MKKLYFTVETLLPEKTLNVTLDLFGKNRDIEHATGRIGRTGATHERRYRLRREFDKRLRPEKVDG